MFKYNSAKLVPLVVTLFNTVISIAKLGRVIGSSLVEWFTNSYTSSDPNGTEEKYT